MKMKCFYDFLMRFAQVEEVVSVPRECMIRYGREERTLEPISNARKFLLDALGPIMEDGRVNRAKVRSG